MKKIAGITFMFFIALSITAQDIDLTSFASGFNKPVNIQHAGDNRLFIVEQNGVIKILNADATTNTTPFLDINSQVSSSGNEQGLLGLAFHPNYITNGFFFVNYTNNSGNTVISRFTVSTDPSIADINSQEILLTIAQPYSNHNGGSIVFGPDGYLYIGMGDGGSGGDPDNYAQNTTSLLGKILRINIDNGLPYTIPTDNPFVSDTNITDEIWAIGVRNPWKFSFDSLQGDVWIADVGQYDYEEINHTLNGMSGLNYGWRCYESNYAYQTSGCQNTSNYTFPNAEYSHTGGESYRCSITGGYVYRGSLYPDLYGLYFFADYCSDEIGTVDPSNSYTIAYNTPSIGSSFVSFGVDNNKELYIAGLNSGTIYKIIDTTLSIDDFSFSNAITISPNPAKDIVLIQSKTFSTTMRKIEVFTILGKKVRTITIENLNTYQLHLETLSQGLYFVKIIANNNAVAVKKLLIQ
jgi:glucose/arabinose dehydrogenase